MEDVIFQILTCDGFDPCHLELSSPTSPTMLSDNGSGIGDGSVSSIDRSVSSIDRSDEQAQRDREMVREEQEFSKLQRMVSKDMINLLAVFIMWKMWNYKKGMKDRWVLRDEGCVKVMYIDVYN